MNDEVGIFEMDDSDSEREVSEVNTCFICYETYENLEDFRILTCLHRLCNSCFLRLTSLECPFCRFPIRRPTPIEYSTSFTDRIPIRPLRERLEDYTGSLPSVLANSPEIEMSFMRELQRRYESEDPEDHGGDAEDLVKNETNGPRMSPRMLVKEFLR